MAQAQEAQAQAQAQDRMLRLNELFLSRFWTDLDPWLGSWPCLDTKEAVFTTRNELFLVQTWTPGWAPGPVWTQKKLFSRRNELFFFSTDLNHWLGSWSCLDPKDAVLKQK